MLFDNSNNDITFLNLAGLQEDTNMMDILRQEKHYQILLIK